MAIYRGGDDDSGEATAAILFTVTDNAKLDGIESLADVTDTANVTAAGALMDSEVDADLKTLVLPASTTISAFGASLIDDAAASNALTTLGLTATAAEINALDGITSTVTELNYTDGVTSAIQTQLDAKQGLDAQLTDVAGLAVTDNAVIIGNGTNFVVESGATLKTSLGLTIGTDVQAYDATIVVDADIGVSVQGYDANTRVILDKLNATVAPAVTDDSGSGYAVGSHWIDVTGDASYTCVDATVGAAVWSSGGGGAGATGAGGDETFVENDQVVTTDYTLTTGKNAHSVGTITINSGVTVTVPSGATWLVS